MGQRYCSSRCWHASDARKRIRPQRKVERPSYEQLLADLRELSWVAVGAKYGVSDNAVRKWFRRYERERGAAFTDLRATVAYAGRPRSS